MALCCKRCAIWVQSAHFRVKEMGGEKPPAPRRGRKAKSVGNVALVVGFEPGLQLAQYRAEQQIDQRSFHIQD